MATLRSLLKFWALSAFAIYGWLRLKLTRSPTLIILTYHRVLPESSDEREREQPGMIVSPGNLQRHIKLIQSLGAVPIHLDEWLRKKEAGEALPALSVAFTFDDGWRDNYLHGYPVLRQAQVPATIFLVTGMVDTGDTFWPEKVIRLVRTPGIDLSDQAFAWLQPYLSDRGSKSTPLSLLEADEIIHRLKELDDVTIIQHLEESTSLLTAEDNLADQVPVILQTEELKEMAGENLVKYGAHTRNHFRLNRLNSKEALEEQIAGCLSDLETMNVISVPIFCYPNGDITDGGEHLVAKHYQAACTTKTGWNRAASRNDFDLHRFNLHDGNSSTARTFLATIGRSLA
ncbi:MULTISPECIES: polysaccharide deacetylase family protein [Marinobacter]|uniref:polysaccharide deacetylase family protein n=1 Tax=Marinobacter TaxID=2742 RepID=UPI001CD97495|nr:MULTISPECIES: polysaccharide deacetylase family protein [Marinobacter]